jgi:hypothetical protein
VVPAHQRLEAGGLAADEVDQRLVVDGKRAGLDRRPEIELEETPRLDARVHLRLEEAEGSPAVALGPIEGDVGVLEKPVGVQAVARSERHADAGADRNRMAVEIVGLGDSGNQPLREVGHVGGVRDIALEHGKFVAAEARHELVGAQFRTEAPGHRPEQQIPDGMAECVVDPFEVVEVYTERRHAAAMACDADEHLLHALAEEHPVRQAGQRVVVGHVGHPSLRPLAFGDVDRGDHQRVGALIVQTAETVTSIVSPVALRWVHVRPACSSSEASSKVASRASSAPGWMRASGLPISATRSKR